MVGLISGRGGAGCSPEPAVIELAFEYMGG